jgi:hypothetical protein
MSEVVERLATGSAAGFAATGPMTAFMEAAGRLLPRDQDDPLPPRHITENTAEAADVRDDMDQDDVEGATMAGHFAYGAGTGALYAALAPHIPLPPAARGVAFGLGLWAASYLGWLPALGLYRPATREPAGRVAVMIAAHVVWGAVAGLVEEQLAKGSERGR